MIALLPLVRSLTFPFWKSQRAFSPASTGTSASCSPVMWASSGPSLMRVAFAQRLTLLADDVGRVRTRFLTTFRSVRSWLWNKLMLEWATQEIHEVPVVALRFAGAIGLIPGLCRGYWALQFAGAIGPWIKRSQGKPALRYTGVCFRAVVLVASAILEGARRVTQQQQQQQSLISRKSVLALKNSSPFQLPS